MFILQSGDVQDLINEAVRNLNINGEEISGDLMIINFLKGEPGDFVISWTPYSPNFTVKGQLVENDGDMIPSGEINFSKMERENPSLHTTMTWVRTITTFSILSIMVHQAWLILMSMLGVSTLIYRNKEETKEQEESKKW